LKRVFAPKPWCLGKLEGVWSTHASSGPYKLRECIPLSVILRNRLKYALSGQEALKMCRVKGGNFKIDNRTRRDPKYPLGLMDVLHIPKTSENFRMLLDIKGRYQPVAIDAAEANFKLCRVQQKKIGKNKIPYIVTHDGRTLRYPHPDIKKNDTVKLNLTTGEIDGCIKFENGSMVYIRGGNNIGRVGTLMSIEHHPGSYEIVNVKDKNGHTFATRMSNVFVIGEGKKSQITLPKFGGIRLSLIEERNRRIARYGGDDVGASDDDEEDQN